MSNPVRHYWLSIDIGYRCRDSGVCCSSGWPIPIERDRAAAIERALARGRVSARTTPWLVDAAGAPPEVAGTLALCDDGRCVFHRQALPGRGAGGCEIYRHRPSSCEHFPYVCAIDPRGVRVALSRYCPTAADLLFEGDDPARIVEGPAIFAGRVPEGLDARESLPPVAAGGHRLMAWQEVTEWEEGMVSSAEGLARDTRVPDIGMFGTAREAVAVPLSWPDAPEGIERAWEEHVAAAWRGFAPAIGRYLASKAFASWALYRGTGLAEVTRAVDVARAVLGVEAVRQAVDAARPLDKRLLREAIRQSDLLLVHYGGLEPEA